MPITKTDIAGTITGSMRCMVSVSQDWGVVVTNGHYMLAVDTIAGAPDVSAIAQSYRDAADDDARRAVEATARPLVAAFLGKDPDSHSPDADGLLRRTVATATAPAVLLDVWIPKGASMPERAAFKCLPRLVRALATYDAAGDVTVTYLCADYVARLGLDDATDLCVEPVDAGKTPYSAVVSKDRRVMLMPIRVYDVPEALEATLREMGRAALTTDD